MKNIKVIIKMWDNESGSLIVSFLPDNVSLPEDEVELKNFLSTLPECAFQPSAMGADIEVEEVLKSIGRTGFTILQEEEIRKNAIKDQKFCNKFAKLVGKTFEYSEKDLFN